MTRDLQSVPQLMLMAGQYLAHVGCQVDHTCTHLTLYSMQVDLSRSKCADGDSISLGRFCLVHHAVQYIICERTTQ